MCDGTAGEYPLIHARAPCHRDLPAHVVREVVTDGENRSPARLEPLRRAVEDELRQREEAVGGVQQVIVLRGRPS